MLVKEKFKDEIVEIAINGDSIAFDICNNKFDSCENTPCDKCLFSSSNEMCTIKRKQYFNSEYIEPVLLSDEEYIILKTVIDKFDEYKYIARDEYENGTCGLTLYIDKPVKEYGSWSTTNRCRDFNMFGNLFQFIKWDNQEPYLIEDLLKNYEKGK